ncbi:CPBP family intramembrane metalloprotease [Pseudomonas aeruginosa]|uniref:CPBP family intramembrane glutamic endopeptidase n=1 Tax=Pseudomonas aeruginosa TaxID=287 RepID=UPI001ADB0570|nr:CPBP family intramembrane glutamic endopeptidase [Pseudomonas aeruginosa]MBO8406824.1 CPBP family intramembrane metalloprotease [Pseudomonas aeruginosa]MCO1999811.1 CPBP family intramembrane metalloprotease [Pseudomonas aeruginosa]HEN8611639.1 CPBP family intramembrane metalloprotease [Pseudomonas aeruginosa]HEN8623604.1 CPBP family intramembrane metalloprotease [Pseudomonas aeruginosa]HEN8653910.1 CPBP family intramembrane metalloprotease [Pseudomonas aeruginosa]
MERAGQVMGVMRRGGYVVFALASIVAAFVMVWAQQALGLPGVIGAGGMALASLGLIQVCQILRPDQRMWGRFQIRHFAVFLLAIVAVQFVCFKVRVALGDYDAGAQIAREMLKVNALGVLVAAPLFEEVIFRGLIWRAVEFGKGRLATAVTVIVTAAAFALFHSQSNIAQLALMGAVGTLLGVARAVSGGVALPITLHIAMNTYVALGAL